MDPGFSADHHGFYHNGNRFYPSIQEHAYPLMEWSNVVTVRLPAQLGEDLDWSCEIALAQAVVDEGKWILWEIDMGLSAFVFTPEDSAAFFSFSLALGEFAKKIWPAFSAHTFAALLYRGGFDVERNFPRAHWETGFTAWKESSDYSVYCAQVFAEYLQRLLSFLPDTLLGLICVDVSALDSPAQMVQLFSKERFEHLHLSLKGSLLPHAGICWETGHAAQGWMGTGEEKKVDSKQPSVGVCLPKDFYLDAPQRQRLDVVFSQLSGSCFRIISEEKLTEEWDGLDELIVLSEAVSPQGQRKLQGFKAAGGSVQVV